MNIWSFLRICLWTLFLIGPIFGLEEIGLPCRSLLFEILLFSSVSLLAPILNCSGEIIFSSLTDKRSVSWKRPDLHINPFRGGKPLQFLWTIYIAFAFAAIGSLVGSLWHGKQLVIDAVAFIAVWFFGYLGIKIAIYVFRSRFEQNICAEVNTEPTA